MYKLWLFLVLLTSVHAIVTIKPVDVGGKKAGLSGELVGAYSIHKGNTDLSATDIGGAIQLDTNTTVSVVKASYKRGDAKEVLTINQGFLHARFITTVHSVFDGEMFVQEQFNTFTKLISRTLLGTGTRINIGQATTYGKGYLGLGGFYAAELEENTPFDYYVRGNIYLSYTYDYQKVISVALVGYYQPRVTNFSDFLVLSTGQLELKLHKKLSLLLSFTFNYDSKPATGISSYDVAQTTALKFHF